MPITPQQASLSFWTVEQIVHELDSLLSTSNIVTAHSKCEPDDSHLNVSFVIHQPVSSAKREEIIQIYLEAGWSKVEVVLASTGSNTYVTFYF